MANTVDKEQSYEAITTKTDNSFFNCINEKRIMQMNEYWTNEWTVK